MLPLSLAGHSLLRRSFIHLKGVGPRSERHLWKQGIQDWDQLLAAAPGHFRGKRLESVLLSLEESFKAWETGDLYYFDRAFSGQDRWRLIPGCFPEIAYFDIEASGGGLPPLAYSTTIAFYFRGELLQEHLPQPKRDLLAFILEQSPMLCTYSGATYDIPFLASEWGLDFRKAHIDLCPWLRRQGYKGGLKAIQKQLSYLPQRTAMDINGFDAVRLWGMYRGGHHEALASLQTYNAEDALILEPLLVDAYNRERELFPQLNLDALVSAPQPQLETCVDPGVYALLRQGESSAKGFWSQPGGGKRIQEAAERGDR